MIWITSNLRFVETVMEPAVAVLSHEAQEATKRGHFLEHADICFFSDFEWWPDHWHAVAALGHVCVCCDAFVGNAGECVLLKKTVNIFRLLEFHQGALRLTQQISHINLSKLSRNKLWNYEMFGWKRAMCVFVLHYGICFVNPWNTFRAVIFVLLSTLISNVIKKIIRKTLK